MTGIASNGNKTAVKILVAIIVSLVVGFSTGRYGIVDLEERVRDNEKTLSAIQSDIGWIRRALENDGFQAQGHP